MPSKEKQETARRVLRAGIMRADRTRVGGIALAVCLSHVPATLLLLPGRDALLGLAGLLLLLGVHRVLFVKLMPPPPPAVLPGVFELARYQWLSRSLTSLAFCLTSLVASFAYHGVLLRTCPSAAAEESGAAADAATTCAPSTLTFTASWAAVVGLAVGADYTVNGIELAGGAAPWPLLSQPPFLRIRPVLPEALSRGVRLGTQCALGLLLAGWLLPSLVFSLGAASLSAAGSCAPCEDGEGGGAGVLLPGARGLGGLFLRGLGFRVCAALALACVRIAYTHALNFRALCEPLGAEAEETLEVAMGVGSHPLTQHLAYLDAAAFAQHDPPRRQALYLAERGAAWPRFLQLLLRPIDETAKALEAARKRRASPPKVGHVPLVPKGVLARLELLRSSLLEQAARSAILGPAHIVMWAAEATSCLIAASASEDVLGAVQLSASLGAALTSLLRCHHALESYVAGGAPLGGARGGARNPTLGSQQTSALRVALGPSTQARAVGAQRAAALEGGLSRALYLLVHSLGRRAALAADVPPELQPRLELFLSETY
jgi:hypothetical protein